jgi:hypothetical protein
VDDKTTYYLDKKVRDNMQLVIDIPEWKYKSICEGVEASKRCGVVGVDSYIHEAIYNGKPLPKGHGRLIDERKIKKCGWNYINHNIKTDAPTIIEADKESEESNCV